jgi:hypothetical protein
MDTERREHGGEGKAELRERLKGLEEWGEEVLKTMRRAHASVECLGQWYDEWRPVEETLDAIAWELQTKLLTSSQSANEEEYLAECGAKWVELLRQGERLYPIWPRQARNEAANALLNALDQSWTAESGSRERREWWTATKNWKKTAVTAIKRNLRIKEGPRRSSWGWEPHEVLDHIVGTGEQETSIETGRIQETRASNEGRKEEETQTGAPQGNKGSDTGARYKCWDRGKT